MSVRGKFGMAEWKGVGKGSGAMEEDRARACGKLVWGHVNRGLSRVGWDHLPLALDISCRQPSSCLTVSPLSSPPPFSLLPLIRDDSGGVSPSSSSNIHALHSPLLLTASSPADVLELGEKKKKKKKAEGDVDSLFAAMDINAADDMAVAGPSVAASKLAAGGAGTWLGGRRWCIHCGRHILSLG